MREASRHIPAHRPLAVAFTTPAHLCLSVHIITSPSVNIYTIPYTQGLQPGYLPSTGRLSSNPGPFMSLCPSLPSVENFFGSFPACPDTNSSSTTSQICNLEQISSSLRASMSSLCKTDVIVGPTPYVQYRIK